MSHSPENDASKTAARRRVNRWGAFALVILVGLALLWPVPLGHMPMSADHPVHLTRIYLLAEQLSHGRLAGTRAQSLPPKGTLRFTLARSESSSVAV